MVSQIVASPDMFPSYPKKEMAAKGTFDVSQILAKVQEVQEGLKLPEDPKTDHELQLKIIEVGKLIGAEAERRSGIDFNEYKYLRNKYIHNLSVVWGTKVLREDLFYGKEGFKTRTGFKRMIEIESKGIKALREVHKIRKIFNTFSQTLSTSYVEVLSEIRPLGGELKGHRKSHFMAKRVFNKTVAKVYPSDWIESSNNHPELPILQIALSGGVYKSGYHGDLKNVTGQIIMTDLIEVPVDKVKETLAKLSENGDIAWIEEPSVWEGDEEPIVGISLYSRLLEDRKGQDDDGVVYKPEGDHWLFGYVPDEEGELPDYKEWYCHGYIVGSEKTGHSPTINIAPNNIGNEQTMSAYHEFIHHMQDRRADTLLRMETAFSIYRTTTDGVRNPLVKEEDVPELPSERYVRNGNFVDTYMGREYPFDHSLEILPTGAEAVFGGGYGGLMGFDDWEADREHRDFVLGIFATV